LYIFSNLLEGWNRNRYFILRRTIEGEPVKKIAKEINLTETAVYKNIYDGNIREMIAIQKIIINKINNKLLEK